MWVIESLLEGPGTAREPFFFVEGFGYSYLSGGPVDAPRTDPKTLRRAYPRQPGVLDCRRLNRGGC